MCFSIKYNTHVSMNLSLWNIRSFTDIRERYTPIMGMPSEDKL